VRQSKEIIMQRILGLTLAATLALSLPAIAAPERERIRGTVTAVGADTLAVHTTNGDDVSIGLGGSTRYLQVVKASLADVGTDSYIGTATKTVGSTLVALEVLIFPPAMKGTGEGHYAWDSIQDTTVAGGARTASMMTNGSVAAPAVASTMTNGSVAAASSKDGTRELTVTYKDGQQTILVPPTAPIVTFKPGAMSDVTKGASVFINAVKDEGKITANAVAVGMDGMKPPM
jgi:hypothetical protein